MRFTNGGRTPARDRTADRFESRVWGSDTPCGTWFDYTKQVWVRDGRYVRCGHPDAMHCTCYGRVHAGEIAGD